MTQTYSSAQLVLVAVVSLALYAVFVFVQTVRHRGAVGAGEPVAEQPEPCARVGHRLDRAYASGCGHRGGCLRPADPAETVLLVLTLFVSTRTLGTGRTTILQGAVHLAITAVFLMVMVVP